MLHKRITLLERRDDLDRAAFSAHWAGPHVPIVLRLPGVRRYLQHHVLSGAEWLDGIVEITFDVADGAATHWSDEQQRDEPRFMSGLTGLPVTGTNVCDATHAAWLVGSPPGGFPAIPGVEPVVSERDPKTPIMRRKPLRSLNPVPDVVTAWPATDATEGHEIAALLVARGAEAGRTAVTRTRHMR